METSAPDFDALAATACANQAAIESRDELYAAAFRLKEWFFIARGEIPNVNPYIAANAGVGQGQHMLKAFTDTERLQRFARECGLTGKDGEIMLLTIPVAGILPTLAEYHKLGVWGIHFNADSASNGFFGPLTGMPFIHERLTSLGLL